MPFITQDRRDIIDQEDSLYDLVKHGHPNYIQPGDRCYFYYRNMVDRWKANPRWTTAHEIYRELQYSPLKDNPDDEAAESLAWQVFFQLYVMPYELKKREENGDI